MYQIYLINSSRKKTCKYIHIKIFYYSKTSQKKQKNKIIEVLKFGTQFSKINQYFKTQKSQAFSNTTIMSTNNNNDAFKFFWLLQDQQTKNKSLVSCLKHCNIVNICYIQHCFSKLFFVRKKESISILNGCFGLVTIHHQDIIYKFTREYILVKQLKNH